MTFTRFIPTAENRAAFLAVQQVAVSLASDEATPAVNPLFLHGSTGTGKTQLVTALVEEVARQAPHRIVTLLPAADWEKRGSWNDEGQDSHPAEASGRMGFLPHEEAARQCDLLIVEDVQHWSGRNDALAAFVAVFDDRLARQRLMVFTATTGPGQLLGLSARLRSRLASGLVLGLEPLGPEGRSAVLQDKAQRRRLRVAPEVLAWLAEHLTGGRQLDGALAQLETLARLQPGPLDVATVAAHFSTQVEAARPTVERIAQRVGRCFEIELRQLQSRRRYPKILVPRQVGMYLARQLTDLSLQQIGAYFGGRDHSTVLHACRKIEETLRRDVALSGIVRQLQADLKGTTVWKSRP